MSIKGVIWATQISSLFDLELRTPSLVCPTNCGSAFEVKEALPGSWNKARTIRLSVLSRHAKGSAVGSVSFRSRTKSLKKTCS